MAQAAQNDEISLAAVLAEEDIFQSAVNGMHSFEHTLEQFYWHASELKKHAAGFLTCQKDLVESLLSNVRVIDESGSRVMPEESALEIYLEVINEAIVICNRDFAQMFERQYLLPIGQARANFNEVNRLAEDRGPMLQDVKHYVAKIDQLQSNTDMKRVVRNQSKLKASLMTLKNHTTTVWSKLTDLDNFRCKIIWSDFTDIMKLVCDLLANFCNDLGEANKEKLAIMAAADGGSSNADEQGLMRRQPSATLVPSNRSMLRYLLKHKNVPDVDKLLADDAEFATRYERFERIVAELPSYTDTVKRYRDAVYELIHAIYLVCEDCVSMINRDDNETEVKHALDLKRFFLSCVTDFNREFKSSFDDRYIGQVNVVCQGLEEVRTRVEARMTNLMDNDHYKALAMAAASGSANNSTTRVWDQYSITQEQFNQDNQMLQLRFQQTDFVHNAITKEIGFVIIESIRTSVLQRICGGLVKVRNEWRLRQGEAIAASAGQYSSSQQSSQVAVYEHQASLTSFDTPPQPDAAVSTGPGAVANMMNRQGSLEERLQNLSQLPTPLQRTIARRMEKEMTDSSEPTATFFQEKEQHVTKTAPPPIRQPPPQLASEGSSQIPGLNLIHIPTVPLTELYEDYTVQLSEESGGYGLGMKLVRKEEVSSVTGMVLDWAVVNIIVPRSPAEMMGVRPNSIVMEVNGQPVNGLSFDQVKNLLREASRPVAIRFMYRRVPDTIFVQQLQSSVSNYLQMKLPANLSKEASNSVESQKQYMNQAQMAQQAQAAAYQQPPQASMMAGGYYYAPPQAQQQQQVHPYIQQQYAMDSSQISMAQRASQQYQMPMGYGVMMPPNLPLTPGPPPMTAGMMTAGFDARGMPVQFNYPG